MKNLNREINLNKKFVVLMILFAIIAIGLYSSYALFEISVIQNNVVVIKTATINITTNITGLDNQTFTLTMGETKNITVNLTTDITNDIGYKMYYNVEDGISLFNVTSTEDYTSTNNKVEGELNTSKTITFTFTNTGDSDITITLGTQGGLKGYPIPLEQGIELKVNEDLGVPVKNAIVTSVNNPTNTSCKTYVEDTDGTIYISGTRDCINFNYVWYSGKLWRVTAIYPDGTMKMITDGLMTTIAYGEDNKFYTNENTTSYMYQWLNQEFLPTLYNYENIIVENAVWNASPGNGTISSKLPIPGQEEVLVNASVGLLNSYEYYKSYQNTSSSNGYLNIGYSWWLLNPNNASSLTVWNVNLNGEGASAGSGSPSGTRGVRPSVNLKSTIQLVGGSGTVDNPYRIKGDRENIEENVTLINTRESGEYVKLVDEETAPTFRIVGTETINGAPSIKLVLNDYVGDTNDVDFDSDTTEILQLGFGTTSSWSGVSEIDSTYWRGYLNNTWIKEIDPTYNSETGTFGMLEQGIYYLGRTVANYKLAVCKTVDNGKSVQDCIVENPLETPTVQEKVVNISGLLRYGEIFASQFGNGYKNSSIMWLITSDTDSYVRNVESSGTLGGQFESPSNRYAARPTINLKSTLVIKSGSGTKKDPFIVGLPS